MGNNGIVLVGTVGQAIWRSLDGGETFRQACAGMFIEADVRALAAHPQERGTLYAGTDLGLYRTENGGERWERLETPFDPGAGWPAGVAVWSLLIHQRDPDIVFVGVCPGALYRTSDGGRSWRKLDAGIATECIAIRHSRVTCIAADTADPDTVWAGVEIDGLHRSRDCGDTWQRCDAGMSSPDIHSLVILPGPSGVMLASTNNDLNLSLDGGATWHPQDVQARFGRRYCRGVIAKADDPFTLFVGNGDGPPGTTGTLQVSRDSGRTWSAASLPTPPNGTVWTFATSADTPDLIFAATVLGQLYRSEDGGVSWAKCRHEFGEIRALAVVRS